MRLTYLAPYRDEDLVAELKVRGYFCVPTSRVRLFSADQAIDLRVVDRLRSNREAEEKFNLSKDHARRMLANMLARSVQEHLEFGERNDPDGRLGVVEVYTAAYFIPRKLHGEEIFDGKVTP